MVLGAALFSGDVFAQGTTVGKAATTLSNLVPASTEITVE